MNIIGHSIKHLRGIKQDLEVETSPITLVVGANSSGKSSYVRTWPLLRQSVETGTTGPILWFGELTDYGDFDTALCNSATNREIDFGFKMRVKERVIDPNILNQNFNHYSGIIDRHLQSLNDYIINAKLIVGSINEIGQTYAKEVSLELMDITVRMLFSHKNHIEEIYIQDEKNILKYDVTVNAKKGLFSCEFM